jgi:hypothetical protein
VSKGVTTMMRIDPNPGSILMKHVAIREEEASAIARVEQLRPSCQRPKSYLVRH